MSRTSQILFAIIAFKVYSRNKIFLSQKKHHCFYTINSSVILFIEDLGQGFYLSEHLQLV